MTITDEAVEAARKAYVASCLSGPNEPMRDALTAALPHMMGAMADLVSALHPFALEAMEWSVNTSGDLRPSCGEGMTTAPAKFTVGDLRRAALAYAAATTSTVVGGE